MHDKKQNNTSSPKSAQTKLSLEVAAKETENKVIVRVSFLRSCGANLMGGGGGGRVIQDNLVLSTGLIMKMATVESF